MTDYSEAIDFDTCSRPEFIRYMMRVEGMTMLQAQEAWSITREGGADVVVDGTFYRPDLEPGGSAESARTRQTPR